MNILFITHNDSFQGSTRSLYSLLEGLRAYPINPFVVVPKESAFTTQLSEVGIPFKIIEVPWWMSNKKLSVKMKTTNAREIRAAARQIEKQIDDWKIDLVYTNSSVTPVGRMAAKHAGVPHIWQIREYWDLYFNLRFIFPSWISKRFLFGSEAVICHATGVLEHYFSNQPKNVYLIHNGAASLATFDKRLGMRQQAPNPEPFTFLMNSVLSKKKGQEHAVRALAGLRERGLQAHLIMTGGGRQDYRNELQALIAQFDLQDSVTFTGLVSDPFPYYYQSDCVLICSENEAFSRVALEAMSTALPVIGKNSGGNPEIIVDGETGLLYNTDEELVEAMSRLAEDRALSQKMGQAGWQRARDKFNIEDNAANVYKVIQLVTENK